MASGVFKAVIPAAGRGLRMRPFSLVLPKEMMPLGRKTMIQLAVEEAISAGIREICIVVRKGKEIIQTYLLNKEVRDWRGPYRVARQSCRLIFIQQKKWDGLGGALNAAKGFIGKDPFLMIIPDQFLVAPRFSASQQLVSQYDFKRPVVLSSMVRIPKNEANYFRGARGFVTEPNVRRGTLSHIVRIRSESQTRSAFNSMPYEVRGFGRTVFPATIFPYLSREYVNRKSGEIDLWKTFKEFPKKIPHFGCLLQGRASDLGSLEGYYHYLPLFAGR